MKLFEKLLIAAFFINLSLCFVDSKFRLLLNLVILTCILSYALFGFKLLNKGKQLVFSIVSGIIFGLAFTSIFLSIKLVQHDIFKLLAWINLGFLLILISWNIIQKKQFKHRGILYRSIVFTSLCSFFAFNSAYNDFYRWCIQEINADNQLYNNMRMFGETEKHDEAIENKDYESAINHALNAKKHGDEWIENYFNNEYDRIGKAYSNLFLAYRDHGDSLLATNQFEKALVNYYKADSLFNSSNYTPFLDDHDQNSNFWNKSRIAIAHAELNNFNKVDSINDYLFKNYKKIKDTIDDDYAYLINQWANSYSKRTFYNEAIQLNKIALEIYNNNPDKHREDIIKTSFNLINSCLNFDSLKEANNYINNSLDLLSPNEVHFCSTLIQKGFYHHKSQEFNTALEQLNESLTCFNSQDEIDPKYKLAALMGISNIHISLSQFSTAKNFISKGYNHIEQHNFGCKGSYLSQINLIEADLYYAKGDLNKALELYYLTYENKSSCGENESDDYIDARMAEIESEFYNRETVLELTDKTLNSLNSRRFIVPSNLSIHNCIANANLLFNPKLSDSLYNVSKTILKEYKLENSFTYASALNGLALLALNKGELKQSDLLLKEAIDITDKLVDQPTIKKLTIITNQIELKFKQKNWNQFHSLLDEARTMLDFLNLKNSIYHGRLNVLEVKFLNSTGTSKGIELLKEALNIFEKIFDSDHPEIIAIKNQLN